MALAPYNAISTPDYGLLVWHEDTPDGERMCLEIEEKETRSIVFCRLDREQTLQLMGCLVLLCREMRWENE